MLFTKLTTGLQLCAFPAKPQNRVIVDLLRIILLLNAFGQLPRAVLQLRRPRRKVVQRVERGEASSPPVARSHKEAETAAEKRT